MASYHSWKSKKSVQIMMIYVVKCTYFRIFFWTSKCDSSPFLGQLRQEKVIYLKRKPYNVPFESNTETGRISVMRGSRRVLVKVVLFQLRGPGHPQDDTTPNFFPDSKSPIIGLSKEVSVVSELHQKDGQNNKSVFKKTCCKLSIEHHCSCIYHFLQKHPSKYKAFFA